MEKFAQTLLEWYGAFGRDLPWRRTRDPYRIWLSEIILQQTRIAQGAAYWERFVKRFPCVEALAAASEDEVLRLWQGLGYYSRARNLHAAARQIVALGAFPDTLDGIRSLKGVGDYTAAAIGSFAFGIPAAVVDGNVYRVLSRIYGIDTPIGTTAAKKQFTDLAQSLLQPERPGDFNQAMMDFGATACTPQNPDCLHCPFSGECAALRSGRIAKLPVKKAGPAIRERWFTYIYFRCDGMTAIHRRGPGDIWQGLWEPYLIVAEAPEPLSYRANASVSPSLRPVATGIRHQLTHQTLHADLWLCEPPQRPELPDEYIWIPESSLGEYALPRLVEILLATL